MWKMAHGAPVSPILYLLRKERGHQCHTNEHIEIGQWEAHEGQLLAKCRILQCPRFSIFLSVAIIIVRRIIWRLNEKQASLIPWNLSFNYIHCTGQFTPKMKANAEPRLLSSLVWIDQYNLCNGMTSFMEFMLRCCLVDVHPCLAAHWMSSIQAFISSLWSFVGASLQKPFLIMLLRFKCISVRFSSFQ